MGNPFDKYFTKEDHLQHAVMEYLGLQYPKILSIHVPNEGRRSPFERYKAKYLGIRSGIPDVLIFKSNKNYFGLAIELKILPNKLTKLQKEVLDILNANGWKTDVIDDFDSAKELIDGYLIE